MVPLTRRAEWSLVRFARGLYFPETAGGWRPEERLELGRGLAGRGSARPLFDALAPLLARGTWRFLARNGGYRRIELVAEGRKRRGRIWESGILDLPLRLGAPTVIWLAAVHDFLARGGPPLPAPLAVNPSSGDRIALAAALSTPALDEEGWGELPTEVQRLVSTLPLLGLFRSRSLPKSDQVRWEISEAEAVALQYLADWLVGSWVRQVSFRRRRSPSAQREIDTGLARAFASLLGASEPDRDQLLVPLARFYPALWKESGGMGAIREALERMSSGVPQQSAREEFLAGFGTVLSFGQRLEERVRGIQALTWADRSEAQKRLAEEYETQYRPVKDEVRLLARHLLREVG